MISQILVNKDYRWTFTTKSVMISQNHHGAYCPGSNS